MNHASPFSSAPAGTALGPVPPADVADDANLDASTGSPFTYQAVQDAVDEIYDLRPKVIRIGLIGTLLHRPDPDVPASDAERRSDLAVLKAEVARFHTILSLLDHGAPLDNVSSHMCRWITALAHENPAELAMTRQVYNLSERVLRAVNAGSADQSDALREHRTVARQGFHTAITTLCEHMWGDFEHERATQLARAEAAAITLGNRLTRLERIGTHVRLVSLNASVEASHIGDRGRGLSLIAQEFKGLAEEVRTLAQEARGDVSMMQGKG